MSAGGGRERLERAEHLLDAALSVDPDGGVYFRDRASEALKEVRAALAAPSTEGEPADRLAAAVAFAAEAHAGQVYRGYGEHQDEAYILHPLRVALAVDPRFAVVAVLHDCLEDAGRMPTWLTPPEESALHLLTRDKVNGPGYSRYTERIADADGLAGQMARAVKIADLRDNLAHDPPDRLRSRYEQALMDLGTDPRAPSTGEGEAVHRSSGVASGAGEDGEHRPSGFDLFAAQWNSTAGEPCDEEELWALWEGHLDSEGRIGWHETAAALRARLAHPGAASGAGEDALDEIRMLLSAFAVSVEQGEWEDDADAAAATLELTHEVARLARLAHPGAPEGERRPPNAQGVIDALGGHVERDAATSAAMSALVAERSRPSSAPPDNVVAPSPPDSETAP